MDELLQQIKACTTCLGQLEHGVRPVMNAHPNSRIAIIGQAPGIKVHQSGIPWHDASGKQLRAWLGVTAELFYDPAIFAIVPMGFCYPGKGKTGDLPPRPECAPQWHPRLLEAMPNIELTLLIGQYAQKYYMGNRVGKNLTETVRDFASFLPTQLPLPHPSPRNRFWQAKNPWFNEDVVPALQQQVADLLA